MDLKIAALCVLFPDFPDRINPLSADSGDFTQTRRRIFDHIQRRGAECLHNRFRILASKPLDDTGRQIFDDALRRNRKSIIIRKDTELTPVFLMHFPATDRFNPLSGGNTGQRADRIVEVAERVTDNQDGITGILVLIKQFLHLAAQGLLRDAVGIRQLERNLCGGKLLIHDTSRINGAKTRVPVHSGAQRQVHWRA